MGSSTPPLRGLSPTAIAMAGWASPFPLSRAGDQKDNGAHHFYFREFRINVRRKSWIIPLTRKRHKPG